MSSVCHSSSSRAIGQGSNSVNVRLFNERVILNALRRLEQASRADLSRYVGLTNNTAGVIVKDLEERNSIRAEGQRSYGRGQPAILLSLDPKGAYAIGVRFGRRLTDTLLVDFRRSHPRSTPEPRRTDEILLTRAFINSLIRHLRASGAMVLNQGDPEEALDHHQVLLANGWTIVPMRWSEE